jgi:peptide/nickel transport system substrate-binding protein
MYRRSLMAAAFSAPLASPALAQSSRARTLRFMPQAALANLDPIFSPSTIITTHAYCVFDTLYGANRALQPRPQMAEGHSVEDDGKRVKIRLRDGLRWHDGEPVRAQDCVASIKRWASRDGFGQILMRATAELSAPDDRTIQFHLHRRFPALFDALAKPGASPCFMMPERIAHNPGDRSLGLEHMIGSGPWRFIANEYVQGSRSHYARNDAYVPRDEPAEAASGGKRVHFDRLEMIWIPDGGTAAAALRTGEIDWIEYPLPDLVPVLERERNTQTQIYDPNGFLGFLRFNHLHPPFNDVRVRRMERARAALREAGYNGEPIIHINPSDFPAVTQQGRLTVELMRRLGVNIQPIEADWATILARRANRNPPAQGGWHLHNTNGPAATIANPAVSFAIRMNGQAAWPGWPSDAEAEAQVEAWIAADDQAAQDAAMRRLQEITWESLPFAPTGLFRLRTAFRRDLTGVLQGPNPFLWNLRRV